MSYIDFYGLSEEPFSNAPVSRFFYNSTQHSEALVRLMHAVEGMKGLALCVGDIGRGKTTLARRLLDNLPEEEYEAALLVIIHSGVTSTWLIKRIAFQLGVESPSQEKFVLLSQLYQRLVEIYEEGRKAVVLIDEAQMLESKELMEELRGLLNLELPERKLLSFVLFGLPVIEDTLRLDPPLSQRVALKYRLMPFDEETTGDYMKHRLRLAGATDMLFPPETVQAIHRYSGGTPRVINTLADNALLEGYLASKEIIDVELMVRVAEDLGLHEALEMNQRVISQRRAGLYLGEGSERASNNGPSPRRVDLDEVDRYLESLKTE